MPRSDAELTDWEIRKYFTDREKAVKYAEKIRKGGKLRAKVARAQNPARPTWIVWTKRKK